MNSRTEHGSTNSRQQTLGDGLLALGEDPRRASDLLCYLRELQRWNRSYNLTAIRDPRQMVTRHLLDSVAVLPAMAKWTLDPAQALRVIDVGSGAGLPGVPLALLRPNWRICVLDSNGKKARFLRHVQRVLALENLDVVHQRVEQYTSSARFDLIISRAFSALDAFVSSTQHLRAPAGRWLAMKGRVDQNELDKLPLGTRISDIAALDVPGLAESRHLIAIRAAAADSDS